MGSFKRFVISAGLVASAPLLLTTLGSFLILFNVINPMQLTFLTSFRVENRTGRPLWVTPVGTFNSGGKDVPPQFATGVLAVPAFRSKEFRVEPGASAWIHYDCDDINLTEIAARDAAGEYRQLVVDPDPPKRGYYRNRRDLYTLDSWDALSPAPADVLAAVRKPDPQRRLWALFATGFVVLALYRALLRAHRRTA
jgi:hypothetical protein